ncbi:MAG: hypothetical protein JWO31_253 [Phycisphaerales bacterium]|nr:hypothetical protein [Phycisphaerales bacterium]
MGTRLRPLDHRLGRQLLISCLLAFAVLHATTTFAADAPALPAAPFAIQVVDDATGRGVPLIELATVSNVRLVTDSAGRAAVDDPALLNRPVFFSITGHGYEFPADGFGMRGRALDVRPGGSATLKVKRLNVAERVYRITGEGLYADTVRLGLKPPLAEPLLNAEVVGQDSAQAAVYRGRVYWFWGDTLRQRYPLGHFGTAGATSDLPGRGGLAPDVGVDLHYFAGPDGFSRPMFARDEATLFWFEGAFVVRDAAGREHLLGTVSRMKSLGERLGRRLVEFDDDKQAFRTLREVPGDAPAALPHGHAFVADVGGKPFVHFADPLPDVRVPATYETAIDPTRYEAFTCVVPTAPALAGPPAGAGGSAGPADRPVTRDADGRARWAWRLGGTPVPREEFDRLVGGKVLAQADHPLPSSDAASGRPVRLHAGSVNWNAYRKRWVMIANEIGGQPSNLGEVYYLEAGTPEGPWRRAVKVVTHDRYSFYNPLHHAFLDQDGGRTIYFEGTYTADFSRVGDKTPRYDYNQVMYRLDLTDERLKPAAQP